MGRHQALYKNTKNLQGGNTTQLRPFVYFYTKPGDGSLGPKRVAYWKQKIIYSNLSFCLTAFLIHWYLQNSEVWHKNIRDCEVEIVTI